jgi:hypothetical protein
MSSFLPVGEQQQQKIDDVRNQLSENEPILWLSVDNEGGGAYEPLNEYQVSHLATMSFPIIFSDEKGDPTNQGCPPSGTTNKASSKIC